MIHIGIYPRKSKRNDESDSMELQINMCTNWCDAKFGKSNYILHIYDGDYGITGHSINKRKDFQRMMREMKSIPLDLIVILRYDRIARNMRDFCNLYYEIEQSGCELVSVSQNIDTTTPYGKKFMYDQASFAELEWSLTSERYKDTAKYKIEQGLAYRGCPPRGFMISVCDDGKKRFVHNPDDEEMVRTALQMYHTYKSKRYVVRWIRANMDQTFTIDMLNSMIKCDFFFGACRDNENFCEPYFSKEFIMDLRNMKQIKAAPTGRIYIFKGLMRCPYCGNLLHGYGRFTTNKERPNKPQSAIYKYYNCKRRQDLWEHPTVNISENNLERQIVDKIDAFLNDYLVDAKTLAQKKKQHSNKMQSLKDELDRLNYLFEKGRIKLEYYEKRYDELSIEIENLEPISIESTEKIKAQFNSGWKENYFQLTDENKQVFWHEVLESITITKDKQVVSVCFKK